MPKNSHASRLQTTQSSDRIVAYVKVYDSMIVSDCLSKMERDLWCRVSGCREAVVRELQKWKTSQVPTTNEIHGLYPSFQPFGIPAGGAGQAPSLAILSPCLLNVCDLVWSIDFYVVCTDISYSFCFCCFPKEQQHITTATTASVLPPDTGISLGLQTCANLSVRASRFWRSKGLCRINLFTHAVCDCQEESLNRTGKNTLNKPIAWLSETAELVQSSKWSTNHLAIHPEEIGWLPYLLICDQLMKWASKCFMIEQMHVKLQSQKCEHVCGLTIFSLVLYGLIFCRTLLLESPPKMNNVIQDDTIFNMEWTLDVILHSKKWFSCGRFRKQLQVHPFLNVQRRPPRLSTVDWLSTL